jgi:uncharacterized membrane protein
MTFYEVLVFVHVLGVVVWVGGSIGLHLFAVRAVRSTDPARVAGFSADAEWIGLRVFMPASLVVLIAGIWAAVDGDWDFGNAWISIGFAAFLVSFFLGMAFLGPESERIKALVAERGLTDPEVARRTGRILMLSRIELVILIVAVWAMVTKIGL